MNFKLKTPKSKDSSLILSYVTLSNSSRFVYSTGEKIPLRLWDTNSQLPKKTKSQNDQAIDGIFDVDRKNKILNIVEQINYNAIA